MKHNIMRYIIIGIYLLALWACSSAENSQDSDKARSKEKASRLTMQARELYLTCVPCHGEQAQGKREMNAPALVNQEAWYLEAQLYAFKKGYRGSIPDDVYGAQMAAFAQTLEEEAINQVVQYIVSLEPVATFKTVDGDVRAGESYYNMICGACHGPGAKGNKEMNAPKLTGIDDWYLERQLLNYRKGIRGSHPDDELGLQMQSMAKTIKDEQTIKDIVAYIQSLQPATL